MRARVVSFELTHRALPARAPSRADRLKRNEASVKFKVLVTMKQVARSGRGEFRRALQRHKDAVKACADFRGPPDPLKGNEPYRKVHDASKEAMEVMFEAAGHHAGGGAHGGGGFGSAGGVAARTTGFSGGGGPGGPGSGGGAYPAAPAGSSPFPSGGGGGAAARPGYAAPSGSSSSMALPGQPGYDPNSVLHQPPVSTGTMGGFGNYDPNKVRAPHPSTVAWRAAPPVRSVVPSRPPPPPPPPFLLPP